MPRITGTVGITYGLFEAFKDYENEREKSFPNAWTELHGGCCFIISTETMEIDGKTVSVSTSSPTNALVRFCPICREAEARWLNQREARQTAEDATCVKYVVKTGDTLSRIVRKFKDSDTVEELVRRNDLADPNRLLVGQTILLKPAKGPSNLDLKFPTKTGPKPLSKADVSTIAERLLKERELDWGKPVAVRWQKEHNRYLVLYATPNKERVQGGDRGVFVKLDGRAWVMPQG